MKNKVYCKECKHGTPRSFPLEQHCPIGTPDGEYTIIWAYKTKNANNDCKDFEPKPDTDINEKP